MRVLLAALLLAGAPLRGASVEGTVALPEAPKKARPGRYPGAKPSEPYQRGPAVVFIDGVKGEFKPRTEKLAIEQKNRQFSPLALAVLAGETVEFPNRDEEYHNVFSRSSAKEIELGRYGTNESKSVTFDKPGVVRLRCEIHSHMHAVVVVLENPCFTVTDDKGAFSIKDVPPGKYTVYAFHEDYEPKDKTKDPLRAVGKEIEVGKDGSVRVELSLKE
jgi:plastocyanin